MTAYKLTPKSPDPVTGFQNPLMGWHFVGAEALNVFTSFGVLDSADWDYLLGKDPNDHRFQQISLTKQMGEGNSRVQRIVKYGQWYAFDGSAIRVLDDADVQANYDVVTYTPAPPA